MLGWIGVVLIRSEELSAKRQLTAISEARLNELVRSIDDVMSSHHRALKQKMVRQGVLENLKSVERTDPFVRRAMWVSVRGQLLYPPAPTTNAGGDILIYSELSVMARQRPSVPIAVRKALDSRNRPVPSARSRELMLESQSEWKGQENKLQESAESESANADTYWHESYFDEGLQLVVWDVLPDGSAIGYWLERSRWIADLIAILPDGAAESVNGATSLTDANGNVLYRWGASDIAMEKPIVEVALKAPLAAWRLRYYLQENQSVTASWHRFLAWGFGISAVGTMLLGLGAYVTFATMQQLRLADQRVSFVGQVSHELRTPLTNIRLYAEMAQRDLAQDSPAVYRVAERLAVIDSESKRLSRLISGVLEFMQGRGGAQPLMCSSTVPDDTVTRVLNQFAPSLRLCGIEVTTNLDARQCVEMDSDLLEQILINLVSNVEKYAASGKVLRIASSVKQDVLTIEVSDEGKGIPSRFRSRIFQPFFRMDNANTSPSGTGLGLTIAKKAAMRHGGNLELLASESGCRFRLTMKVKLVMHAPESLTT